MRALSNDYKSVRASLRHASIRWSQKEPRRRSGAEFGEEASRLCDLARRTSDPEHRRYLLGQAAEAARQAETLEREAVAKPDKAASDPKATGLGYILPSEPARSRCVGG